MMVRNARRTALGILTGAAVGMFAAKAPSLLMLVVIACIGMALGRRPVLLLGLFLMIDQTYTGTRYYAEIGPLVTTGHQLYEPVKNVPPALLLILLALGIQLYSGRRIPSAKLRTHGLDLFGGVLVALLLWTAMLSLVQEEVDFSAGTMLRIATNTLNATVPWLLALAAYAVAVRLLREPDGRAQLARVVAAALILKGVLGLLVLLTTQGAVIDGQHNVVYYDAALPMVAGMAIIGFLLASQRDVPWRKTILLLAGTIVLFSFRRCVWSAMFLAVALLPLIRMRSIVVQRIATAVAVSLLLVLVLPTTVKRSAFSRVGSAVSVAQGTGNEESAQHHKKDVARGYQIAQEHAFIGIGVRAPQRREFAFQDTKTLYVHNDPLQVWLRLGLPGVVLYVMLLGVLCWRGVATLRRPGVLSVLDAGCATFAVVCLVPVVTAPFISETARWPVLIGIVAAVLRTSATDARDAAVATSRAASEAKPAVQRLRSPLKAAR